MENEPLSSAMPETNYVEAIDFYSRALDRIDAVDTVSSLLLNCATVTMKMDTSKASARMAVAYAAAALTIAPCYEKARVRLFNELRRLGQGEMVKGDDKLHTDSDILLAVSDEVEGCIDEILVRHGEISEMKKDASVAEGESPCDLKAKGNALATQGRSFDALMVYLFAI